MSSNDAPRNGHRRSEGDLRREGEARQEDRLPRGAPEVTERAVKAEAQQEKLERDRTLQSALPWLFRFLVSAAIIIAAATMAVVHNRARRDRHKFTTALTCQATRKLTDLDKAAIDELARHHAMASEARVMLRVGLWKSVVGAVSVALVFGILLSLQELKQLSLEGKLYWEALLGMGAPVAALVYVYNTVHSNYVTTMNLCRELGFLDRNVGGASSALPAAAAPERQPSVRQSSRPPRAA